MKCIDCARFSLRAGGERMAEQGFGGCALAPAPGRYVAALFERQCDESQRCDNGAARLAWIESRTRSPPTNP